MGIRSQGHPKLDNPYNYRSGSSGLLKPAPPVLWYGDRAVFAGGESSSTSTSNEMGFVTIASTGNASDFGNLTQGRSGGGAYSNGTRGAFSGGYKSPGSGSGQYSDVIDYITIASTGNAADFGDLSQARYYPGSLSGDA